MIKIKDRKRQRLNRRLKHKEELLDKKNDLGVKDLTAYNAVKQNGNKWKSVNSMEIDRRETGGILLPQRKEHILWKKQL